MAYGYNNRDFKGANPAVSIINFVVIACLMVFPPLALLYIIILCMVGKK